MYQVWFMNEMGDWGFERWFFTEEECKAYMKERWQEIGYLEAIEMRIAK